jgi:hypothetical protein
MLTGDKKYLVMARNLFVDTFHYFQLGAGNRVNKNDASRFSTISMKINRFPNTESKVMGWINRSGKVYMAAECSGLDRTPPQLLTLKHRRISWNTVVVEWKTNEPSRGIIQYGKSRNFGNFTDFTNEFSTEGLLEIPLLDGNTEYYFRLWVGDKGQNIRPSGVKSFVTGMGPRLGGAFKGFSARRLPDGNALFLCKTIMPLRTRIEFGDTQSYGNSTPWEKAGKYDHKILIDGLGMNKIIHYRWVGMNSGGGIVYSENQTFRTHSAAEGL